MEIEKELSLKELHRAKIKLFPNVLNKTNDQYLSTFLLNSILEGAKKIL